MSYQQAQPREHGRLMLEPAQTLQPADGRLTQRDLALPEDGQWLAVANPEREVIHRRKVTGPWFNVQTLVTNLVDDPVVELLRTFPATGDCFQLLPAEGGLVVLVNALGAEVIPLFRTALPGAETRFGVHQETLRLVRPVPDDLPAEELLTLLQRLKLALAICGEIRRGVRLLVRSLSGPAVAAMSRPEMLAVFLQPQPTTENR